MPKYIIANAIYKHITYEIESNTENFQMIYNILVVIAKSDISVKSGIFKYEKSNILE